MKLTEEHRKDLDRVCRSFAAEWSRQDLKMERDQLLTEGDKTRLDLAYDTIVRCVESIAIEQIAAWRTQP